MQHMQILLCAKNKNVGGFRMFLLSVYMSVWRIMKAFLK